MKNPKSSSAQMREYHGGVTRYESQVRREKRRENSRRKYQRMRRRFFTAVVFAAVLIVVVMLFTPFFNIKTVVITGLENVTEQQAYSAIGDVEGNNVFRTSVSKIRKSLDEIPYFDTIHIQRKLFPARLLISVTECTPGGNIEYGGQYIVIDTNCGIMDIKDLPMDDIPEIVGMAVSGVEEGEELTDDDPERISILAEMLTAFNDTGILRDVDSIDMETTTAVSFEYDNRLSVSCGSGLNIDKKIRMFKETVYSSSLADNAKGTIDLSVTGKAVYAP